MRDDPMVRQGERGGHKAGHTNPHIHRLGCAGGARAMTWLYGRLSAAATKQGLQTLMFTYWLVRGAHAR